MSDIFSDPSIPSIVREDYYDPERNIVKGATQPLRSRYPQPSAASIKVTQPRYAEDFVAAEGEGLTGQRKYTPDPEVSADERHKYVDKYKYWTHPQETDVRINPYKRTSKLLPAHYFVSGFKNPLHGFAALSRVYNSRMDALRAISPQTYKYIKDNGYVNVPIVAPMPTHSMGTYRTNLDAGLGIPSRLAALDSAYAEVAKPLVTKINQLIPIEQWHYNMFEDYYSPSYNPYDHVVVFPNNDGFKDPVYGTVIDRSTKDWFATHELDHPLSYTLGNPQALQVAPKASDTIVNSSPVIPDELANTGIFRGSREGYVNKVPEGARAMTAYIRRFYNRHGWLPKTFQEAVLLDSLTGHIQYRNGTLSERGLRNSQNDDIALFNGILDMYGYADALDKSSITGKPVTPLVYKAHPNLLIPDKQKRAKWEADQAQYIRDHINSWYPTQR